MDVVDPSTGERIESYADHTQSEVEEALDRANAAFEDWRLRPVREREELLAAAGEILRENKRKYAETMTREMGKPISQALAEVEKCAWGCDHYAEHANAYLEPEGHPSPPGAAVETVYEPLGPVFAVTAVWHSHRYTCSMQKVGFSPRKNRSFRRPANIPTAVREAPSFTTGGCHSSASHIYGYDERCRWPSQTIFSNITAPDGGPPMSERPVRIGISSRVEYIDVHRPSRRDTELRLRAELLE